MNDELPKGWAKTTLGQICSKPQYGWTCRAAKNGKIKYLRTSDISEGKIDWQSVPYCEEIPDDVEKYRVYPNDILVARAGSVGVSHRVRDTVHEAVFASYLIRFTAWEGIEPRFIEFSLKSHEYWQAISDFAAGIAIPNVNATKLASLELPLAPLNEQNRIVAKLEKLVGKVDACQQRLTKIPVILKRFRQSVLAAACSGRLTADWREQNAKVESADSLLSRIKERRLASAQSKKEQAQVLKAFGKQNLLSRDDELDVNGIPNTWTVCRIGAIGAVCNGSTPSRKESSFWGGNIPWVSSGEVRNNIISLTRERITDAGYESCSVRLLPQGTVLLAMIGEGKTRGQTAILKIEASINQNIAAVILDHGLIYPEYLWRWFQLQYESTREHGSGSGPPALNCDRVRDLPFVLPPFTEQQEISRRLEALFMLADQIEARFTKAKACVDQLTQSLLAKAFRGELVPQDPNDEPASVLLERIKAEQTKGETEGKGGGKKRLKVNRKGKSR
jgi:type I restriction enzyme S subunit